MQYSRKHPSPHYLVLLEEYRKIHASGAYSISLSRECTYAGFTTFKRAKEIRDFLTKIPCLTLLDYGSGKGFQYEKIFPSPIQKNSLSTLQKYWGLRSIICYDPAYPPFEKLPDETYDAVICIDVLEHVPIEDIDWILHEIFSKAHKLVYISVACFPARKTLSNGENAHRIIKEPKWWHQKIAKIAKSYPVLKWTIYCESNTNPHK